MDGRMRRVSVVGCSGSGKSRLAERLASHLGVPHVNLDAIFHLPNWQHDPEAFHAEVSEIAASDGWVIDGNYRSVVLDGPVWPRADTVVWIDLPRLEVMRQLIPRTLRRVVTREELWNGNRETLRNLMSWDPEKSVIRWSWTRYDQIQERYRDAMRSPRWAHLDFVHLTSSAELDAWLAGVPAD